MSSLPDNIELILRTATRIALYVDQENGAPDFWDAVETHTPPNADAARLRDLTMNEPLIVTRDEARRILAWAVILPEWDDDEAPVFAPHPILVQDADEDQP